MILAIDIDEVVANTLPAFLRHYNQKFLCSVNPEHFATSDWALHLKLSPFELDAEIREFICGPHYASLLPVGDAESVLTILSGSHTLYAVTSRWGELQQTTEQWLEEYFPNIFAAIYFSSSSHANVLQPSSKSKAHICKEIGADLMIEDCPKHLADCLASGLQVAVFDRPWNRSFVEQEAWRINSWIELLPLLE